MKNTFADQQFNLISQIIWHKTCLHYLDHYQNRLISRAPHFAFKESETANIKLLFFKWVLVSAGPRTYSQYLYQSMLSSIPYNVIDLELVFVYFFYYVNINIYFFNSWLDILIVLHCISLVLVDFSRSKLRRVSQTKSSIHINR